jgi:hypothetical protein
MSRNDDRDLRDLERRLPAALTRGTPPALPGLADRLLARTAGTPQRRHSFSMSLPTVAVAGAIVVIAIIVGLGYSRFTRQPGVEVPPVTSSPSFEQDPSPSDELDSTPVAPTVAATPSPSSAPSATEAQACTNTADGFTVEYPSDWFTNDRVEQEFSDPVPACRYFGADPLEILPNAGLPPTVAITIQRASEPPRGDPNATVVRRDEVVIDGRPAVVTEEEWPVDPDQATSGHRRTTYTIETASGDFLVAATKEAGDDHEPIGAVLEAMMASIELD